MSMPTGEVAAPGPPSLASSGLRVIFKVGDDLRQDQLTIQMIREEETACCLSYQTIEILFKFRILMQSSNKPKRCEIVRKQKASFVLQKGDGQVVAEGEPRSEDGHVLLCTDGRQTRHARDDNRGENLEGNSGNCCTPMLS